MKEFVLLLCAATVVAGQYYGVPACPPGKDVTVHLFSWKWSDIQAACPGLASAGYCAVQISPAQEHVLFPSNEPAYPWWQMYQPVSYTATTSYGDETAFRAMCDACNAAGIRIYADAVINHMTGSGTGVGSAGNTWDGGDDVNNVGQSFPGVPFGEADFHGATDCPNPTGNVEDYQNAVEVRNCRLYGLRDLRLGESHPRQMVQGYMQKLLDWGVAGFRIDAAKFMDPADLEVIYSGLRRPDGSPPFIFQEVVNIESVVKPGDYTHLARVTEFTYGINLSNCVRGIGCTLSDVKNIEADWGLLPSMDALTFVDNHDNQRNHGGGGSVLSFKEPREYEIAQVFTLAYGYGVPRVMSSYQFTNEDAGPPSDANGVPEDVDCTNGNWVCEHEWNSIVGMVGFHNAVAGANRANWWDNGDMAISFSRDDLGFVFINGGATDVTATLQTGLPPGEYCDVTSCDSNVAPCSGGAECVGSIVVDDTGLVDLTITAVEAHPYRAYHV